MIVPGWNTLKSTAEKNWGKGSYNVVTNDKDVRTYPISFAVELLTSTSSVCQPTSAELREHRYRTDRTERYVNYTPPFIATLDSHLCRISERVPKLQLADFLQHRPGGRH